MRVITSAIFVVTGLHVAQAQANACFADWSAASAAVKAHGLVAVDELTRLAPAKLGGMIVRSNLCEERSVFVYRLVVRDSLGQIKTVVVDAKRPF